MVSLSLWTGFGATPPENGLPKSPVVTADSPSMQTRDGARNSMNTENGSILHLPAGSPVPEGHVALKHAPNPNCGVCKGNGTNRRIVKKPGKRGKFTHEYKPCPCTDTDIAPEVDELWTQKFQARLGLIAEPLQSTSTDTPVHDENFMRQQAGKFMRKMAANQVATEISAKTDAIFKKTAEPPHIIVGGGPDHGLTTLLAKKAAVHVVSPPEKPSAPTDMVPDLPDIKQDA